MMSDAEWEAILVAATVPEELIRPKKFVIQGATAKVVRQKTFYDPTVRKWIRK